MLVGRAHEGHDAIARRAIDSHAGLHQSVASCVDVVDLVSEVAEIARFAVVLGVPVEGEFHLRARAAGLLAGFERLAVIGPGQENKGISVLLVHPPAGLLEPELVAIEIERGIEIAHAQHGVQKSHGTDLTNKEWARWRRRQYSNDCNRSSNRD